MSAPVSELLLKLCNPGPTLPKIHTNYQGGTQGPVEPEGPLGLWPPLLSNGARSPPSSAPAAAKVAVQGEQALSQIAEVLGCPRYTDTLSEGWAVPTHLLAAGSGVRSGMGWHKLRGPQLPLRPPAVKMALLDGACEGSRSGLAFGFRLYLYPSVSLEALGFGFVSVVQALGQL